jgi:hypothetical protein
MRARNSIAVAAVVAALAAAPASGARADAEFRDARGDGRGSPDIWNVSVSNDAKGEITFFVLVLGNVAPPADASITLVLDTDRNEATGSDGFNYVFQYYAASNQQAVASGTAPSSRSSTRRSRGSRGYR